MPRAVRRSVPYSGQCAEIANRVTRLVENFGEGSCANLPFKSVFDEPPTLLLDAALGSIKNQQLASLLEFGVATDKILAFIVVVYVLGRWFVGMDPFG